MDKVILFDSDEAAKYQEVKGWVSSKGRFFGKDERSARYDGCTHKTCQQCGATIQKGYLYCDTCLDKKEEAIYKSMPVEEWDYETPLAIFRTDTFFFDSMELEDYCDENEINVSELQLVLCEPVKLMYLDNDFFYDCLSEDQDLPDGLAKLIEEFNQKVEAWGKKNVLSWEPANIRVLIKEAEGNQNG